MLNVNETTIDAYKQKIKAEIKDMKAKMHIFEAGVEKANADMRIKYQKNLNEWKSRIEDIDVKLNELSDSTGDAWEDMRAGIDKAVNELGDAMENAKEQFGK